MRLFVIEQVAHAEVLLRNMMIRQAIDEYATLINMASGFYAGVQSDMSALFYKLGMCFLMARAYPMAMANFQKAIVTAEKCDGMDDERVMAYLSSLVSVRSPS